VRRSDQRRAAVIALYQHDLTGRPLAETHDPRDTPFSRALASVAADRAAELDLVIDRHSHGWPVSRIAPLERSIMRVALAEMLHPGEIPAREAIPAEGAIEEAVETAKVFCSHEAPAFVNGVLAAALRELRDNVRTP
jgi:transcription antitermination protein NusB